MMIPVKRGKFLSNVIPCDEESHRDLRNNAQMQPICHMAWCSLCGL